MWISTAYGVLTLEAKWLVPAATLPADVARDPKSCLISVTIELHEYPIAHAARVLRESGATPTQTKVGIQLALGKPKPVIADELGIQLSSVAEKALSDSRCSQFRRASHKNLAWPKTRRGAPIFAARRISRGPNADARKALADIDSPAGGRGRSHTGGRVHPPVRRQTAGHRVDDPFAFEQRAQRRRCLGERRGRSIAGGGRECPTANPGTANLVEWDHESVNS
jgi:hypothetical protein